jgi:hypothetical protein
MTEAVWTHIFADPADHERIPWGRDSLHFQASPDTSALLSFQLVDDWLRYRRLRYPQFLSTFLGHSGPEATYWYLQATPELLALAAQRLEQRRSSS